MDTSNPLRAADLREAMTRHHLGIALQPRIDVRSGKPALLEAFCRWPPELGDVPPSRLLALAKASGLEPELTLYLVDAVVERLAEWRRERPQLRANVGLSLVDLLDAGFRDRLLATIADERSVGVQVTEGTLLSAPTAAGRALLELHDMGLHVEIDHFGTGYSSRGQLIELPIGALKIDRRFVGAMAVDHRRRAVVRAAIALAHDLGIAAVADGVEDAETWELVRALGCDAAVGDQLARAMAPGEVPAWLADWDAGVGLVAGSAISGETVASPVERRPSRDVLVVEDDGDTAALLADVLRGEGIGAVVAANGAEALREIERAKPAVVLLDMQMPVLDGEGVARAIHERKIDVPIVVMTAGPSASRWAAELSADGWLSKPFDIASLLSIANRYAGRSEPARTSSRAARPPS